jgi:hypothetical protein
MAEKEKQRTPRQERFHEEYRIHLLCEEFCVPKVVKTSMGAALGEVFDKPENFWRLARMLRRSIVSRSILTRRSADEEVGDVY